MKKFSFKSITNLVTSASFTVLTIILFNVANSTSCFFVYQPKEPRAIDSFKWTK